MDKQQFCATFGPPCQAAMRKNGGFASVRMAQIALESGWGEATPVDINTGRPSNNYTGVKGKGPAGSVQSWTSEFENGEWIKVVAEFRAYNSIEEHVILRDDIFLNWPENYGAYLAAKTPEAAIHALVTAPNPYATDPNYEQQLLSLLDNFRGYDDMGFKDVPDDAWYAQDVAFLQEAGIIKGYEDGTFRPDEPVSRAEVAHLMRLVIRYITGK